MNRTLRGCLIELGTLGVLALPVGVLYVFVQWMSVSHRGVVTKLLAYGGLGLLIGIAIIGVPASFATERILTRRRQVNPRTGETTDWKTVAARTDVPRAEVYMGSAVAGCLLGLIAGVVAVASSRDWPQRLDSQPTFISWDDASPSAQLQRAVAAHAWDVREVPLLDADLPASDGVEDRSEETRTPDPQYTELAKIDLNDDGVEDFIVRVQPPEGRNSFDWAHYLVLLNDGGAYKAVAHGHGRLWLLEAHDGWLQLERGIAGDGYGYPRFESWDGGGAHLRYDGQAYVELEE